MFSKTPTKGMRDFLPNELNLRQKVMSTIYDTYKNYGFCAIETPCVENLQLLTSKQGGDNEKLIFKILKRGEKLADATEDTLCDLGLRFDLTIPLARYYANNCGNLPTVFKAMQIDRVWRADRPQKGRYRQFVQCDIDIIGEQSNIAEIELICATIEALSNLGFSSTIRINDRQILTALLKYCGFDSQNFAQALIILDKMDKIGVTGVLEEIEALEAGKSEIFVNLISKISSGNGSPDICFDLLKDFLPIEVCQNMREILSATNHTAKNGKVVFDITLVRGMDYYTGTIFEISLDGLSISAGGGGRYDKLIGKITGNDVSACGFSIGFERIIMLLEQQNSQLCQQTGEQIAVVVPKDIEPNKLQEVLDTVTHLRKSCPVNLVKKAKNFAYQLNQLKAFGATTIFEYQNGQLIKKT